MALIKCKVCSTEVSSDAEACPKCGHPIKARSTNAVGLVIILILVIAAGFWWLEGGGLDSWLNSSSTGSVTQQTVPDMSAIKDQVANDAVKQYYIAVRQGDPIQVCVQAGLVAAAYLQAEDGVNYNKWKQTQTADCQQAGIAQ